MEASVKVYFTKEYGRFKWLKGNRSLSETKIKKIMNAVESGVNILKYAPIIVNENMEIIDGQHRFMVCKQLKENVFYVIQRDADLSIVPIINSNSQNWKKKDYLNSYVDLGKAAYVVVQQLIEEYPGLAIPVACSLVHEGKANGTDSRDAFTDGQLQSKFAGDATALLNMAREFTGYITNPYSRRFLEALELLSKSDKYEQEVMLNKLNESERRIQEIHSVKAIITEMESIYNHRLRNRVYII